ncbi:MAG: glycosyl transferase, partial [Treponema sp.]|nr:glycosyl transferase [Treponema sp.]
MKYVYVLVSSPADFYYEQCLMSLTSLRFYMKEAEVFVLCDQRTANTFSGKRAAIKELAKIISVPFEDTVGNTERSRLIKTAIPDYVQGDFLYIDCDTIICSDLSAIEEFPYEIAGVLDAHVYLDEHLHKQTFVKRDKKLGFHGTAALNGNINGGLVLARDTPYAKEFFKAWNEAWKYSAYKKNDMHDQSALNEANYRTQMKAQLLPGEWNCQPCHGGLAFLKDAKIIHY